MSCTGWTLRVLWFVVWLTPCFFGVAVSKRTTLYLAGFFPTNEAIPEGEIGRGVIPAVKLALEHVNSSPVVLKGYHLALVWNDTKCDAAVGMKSFFDMLATQPAKIILFGDACTSVTDPIAKASQFFHLVQLSYADTHPMYTLENYPNFFRVIPSEAAFNPARLALLRRFNWTRVGTLYQNLPRYSLPHSKLMTLLDEGKIEIAGTQSFTDKLQNELQKLKDKDVRIIVGNFEETWARHIFCRAYHVGLYGRKYQWIIVGTYRYRWWEVRDPNVTCQTEELREAMEGYIATDVLPLSSSDEITASGLTAAEYESEYSRTRKLEYSRFHGYAYDGVWAAALAIQSVIKKLRSKNSPLTIKDFEYRDQFWGTLFKEAFNETYFIGVTGPVSFSKNERKGLILLKQFQHGAEVKVGEYDSNTDFLDLSVGERIMWRGSYVPPLDRTLIVISPSRVNLTIYLIVVIFAVLGIIMASVFLVINIKFRNQRYIKMSSPYLNNMIIVGCILTYISVILLGLDSGLTSEKNFRYICAARAWVLMSGFTLAFGSMFSKTWRVHAIFTNIKLNKKVIKDYKLFIVVGVLVMIDIIILTTWQIIDPFFRETSKGEPILSPENDDLQFIPEMEFCQSHNMTIFLGCIYAYKGLLMLVELKRNPQAGDRRVRATLKPLKKSRRDSDDIAMHSRIKLLQDENMRFKQKLEEKSVALQALVTQLKQLEESTTLGQGKSVGTPIAEQCSMISEGETSETIPVARSSDDIKSVISKGSQDLVTPIEDRLQLRKSSISLQVSTGMPSEKEGRLSCPDLAGAQKITHVDQAVVTEIMNKRSPLEQLHPQLLIDRMNREVRFTEAESSTNSSSETIQSKRSPAGGIEPKDLPLESDDTSYARAIKSTQVVNGLSSSCDEDTDRCDAATYSEAESDSSRHYASSVRRRAKSLGALRTGTSLSEAGGRSSRSNQPGVSVINASQTQASMLPPLFPYFSQIASDTQPSSRTAQKDAMFSSYPTIKCDIVEYL